MEFLSRNSWIIACTELLLASCLEWARLTSLRSLLCSILPLWASLLLNRKLLVMINSGSHIGYAMDVLLLLISLLASYCNLFHSTTFWKLGSYSTWCILKHKELLSYTTRTSTLISNSMKDRSMSWLKKQRHNCLKHKRMLKEKLSHLLTRETEMVDHSRVKIEIIWSGPCVL